MRTALRKDLRQIFTNSRVPRYVHVASVLRRRISDGRWHVGERISTIEELADEFGVARVTVRFALDMLQDEGIVRSFQGKGTFVTKADESDRWLQLSTDWEGLIAPICNNVLQLLEPIRDAQPTLLEHEYAAPSYRYIRSLQLRHDVPYALASVHVASHLFDLAPKQFNTRVAIAVLSEMTGLDIARAQQTIEIGAADVATAQHLLISLGAPTAEARCVVCTADGVAIYVGELIYRGDCMRLQIDFRDFEKR